MRTKIALDLLRAAIRALKLNDPVVVSPNTLADLADNALYFEIYASEFATRPETERSAVTRCDGTIVIADAVGFGYERVDAIAQALLDLFASYGELAKLGCCFLEPIAGADRSKRARLYVVGVERSNGVVTEGRYKVKIVAHLEIYEGGGRRI